MDLVLANQIPNRRRRHEDLERDHATSAARLRQQRLTDDPLEHERQLSPDLRLLMRRKHVDDAVNRLRRRVRVQRAERQVACLGDPKRRLGGFEVAQLADENDVRILAQRRTERFGKSMRVGMHLSLIDEAAFVLMDVLDRIFDRENVLVALVVDFVEHGGERGRLAATGWPCHKHEPARPLGQRRQHLRQRQLLEALDLFGNQPVNGAHGAALVEHVGAEPRHPANTEREVELEGFLEALLLRVGHHAVGQLLGVGRRQVGQIEPLQPPVHAHLRRRIRRQMEVRSSKVDGELEQFR